MFVQCLETDVSFRMWMLSVGKQEVAHNMNPCLVQYWYHNYHNIFPILSVYPPSGVQQGGGDFLGKSQFLGGFLFHHFFHLCVLTPDDDISETTKPIYMLFLTCGTPRYVLQHTKVSAKPTQLFLRYRCLKLDLFFLQKYDT